MRQLAFAMSALIITSTTAALAADVPTLNEPPRGPGTELKSTLLPVPNRVVPGWEVSGQVGGGLGFGLGARGGYTLDRGIYVGGSYTHYWGSSVITINGEQRTSRNMFGGDIGYKMLFLDSALEVRPFVFLGADFFHETHPETITVTSETAFAVHTCVLGAYHFGPAYVSGEFQVLITPTPVHVAAFGGFGWAL